MSQPLFRTPILIVFSLVVVVSIACAGEETADTTEPTPPPVDQATSSPKLATAELLAREGGSVNGTVRFEEQDGKVLVTAEISGLEPGSNGFHIHEIGDCSAADFTSAGGHFNPLDADHGSPTGETRHVGDLGNLQAGEDGRAEFRFVSELATLDDSDTSILGRAVIVHEGEDDFTSQPSGAAGSRVACGIVELSEAP